MTIEDYQKNLRGVNDGQDFSPEFLVSPSWIPFQTIQLSVAKHL